MQFLDPKVDTVFKKLFGSENHQQIIMSFLNSMLENTGDREIVSIEFNKDARVPEDVLSIICTDKKKRGSVVELHNAWLNDAFDRELMAHMSRAYTEQPKAVYPYFHLDPIAIIALTKKCGGASDDGDYKAVLVFADTKNPESQLDFFKGILIELDYFNKKANELVTDEDKWLFVLKNLDACTQIPETLQSGVFQEACKVLAS